MNESDKKLLDKAINFQKEDDEHRAIEILFNLLSKYPNNKSINGLLGSIYSNLEYYDLAKNYLENAVKYNSNYELFHLSLYITYFELDRHEDAFKVLFNYLEKNNAYLFKDTLEELLNGLIDKYGEDNKNKIIYYSIKNNIKIPPELIDKGN